MRLPGASTSKMRKLAVPGAWLRAMLEPLPLMVMVLVTTGRPLG